MLIKVYLTFVQTIDSKRVCIYGGVSVRTLLSPGCCYSISCIIEKMTFLNMIRYITVHHYATFLCSCYINSNSFNRNLLSSNDRLRQEAPDFVTNREE